MYFIINTSRPPKDVSLFDLGIVIGPKKAMDLEKIWDREKIDASVDLQEAIRNRQVQVRHNSVKVEHHPVVEKPKMGADDFAKIRQAIRDEVKNLVPPNTDMSQIVGAIGELKSMMQNAPAPPKPIEEEEPENNEKISKIHAKVVQNKTKGIEGNIQYRENKSDASLSKRVKDLDDLIDG